MSTLSPTRIDPYKNFKFLLWMEGRHVYGGNQLAGALPFGAPGGWPSGAGPMTAHKSPGRNKYDAITLKRGITYDPGFQNWANSVSHWSGLTGAEVAPVSYRKTIYLEIYNEAGQLLTSYQLSRCWACGYKGLPALGGDANAIAIEHLELACEGIQLAPAPHRHSH